MAIKVLPSSVAGDADHFARFQREAEVLAALNHSNIGAIYALERGADQSALVMELVGRASVTLSPGTRVGPYEVATGRWLSPSS